MKQPKFKFGDKLLFTNFKTPFTVKSIQYADVNESYYYSPEVGDCPTSYKEEMCELYEEPKPKKLYAYLVNYVIDGKHFAEVKYSSNMDLEEAGSWKRNPEYDIELPLSKASSAI